MFPVQDEKTLKFEMPPPGGTIHLFTVWVHSESGESLRTLLMICRMDIKVLRGFEGGEEEGELEEQRRRRMRRSRTPLEEGGGGVTDI